MNFRSGDKGKTIIEARIRNAIEEHAWNVQEV